jgi:UDP-N-acetylmuramate--alanine ligase
MIPNRFSAIPLTVGPLHFIGIGGIGMSGLAEVLHHLGYTVQGSDMSDNANVARLRKMGVKVMTAHDPANVAGAGAVIVSSAVKETNPEWVAARAGRIPVIKRADMLAELARFRSTIAVAGTHGKTTTTTLVACLLDAAGLDPTMINGGIVNAYGTNARLGSGSWLVAEADESDGTFLRLNAEIAVVTNIDPEHLDYYGTEAALHQAFDQFIHQVPFYGAAVLCLDHPVLQAMVPHVTDRRVITYGLHQHAMVRGFNITTESNGTVFDVTTPTGRIEKLSIPLIGQHNVQNALAALAVAHQIGISEDAVRRGFAAYQGVKRRFTKVAEVKGITIIDDYAHHPTEIDAVLSAAALVPKAGRVIAVVQPHRYSRLGSLWDAFATVLLKTDALVLLPVYSAGEEPLPEITHTHLAAHLRSLGHPAVFDVADPAAAAETLKTIAHAGDMIVCMGAGNITAFAHQLPELL